MIWLWIIAGHLAADFIFQSDRLIRLKELNLLKGLAIHALIHASVYFTVLTVAWMFFGGSVLSLLFIIITVSVLHFAVDYIKIHLNYSFRSTAGQTVLFLSDQAIHIAIILGAVFYFIPGGADAFTQQAAAIMNGTYNWHPADRAVAIISLLITGTWAAGYFLGILLQNITPKDDIQKNHYTIENERTEVRTRMLPNGERESEMVTVKTEQLYRDSPQKTGRYIGMLERLLIIVLLVLQLPHGLAFLAALKSLTRFKQFDNKQFAEYYLIGTIASSLIGLCIGMVALAVIR
ncbi:DUF3307 domain-containing protein [Alteribacter natronophilus]|uniref:DUF3307 domain-containing protein n=1 Tax=Alteribacter natronophilus TaxID=2583810 RepID=UPI001486CEBD|nr:DUF3307 domain-containing protein [Alteribacter natronophilus]